MNGYELLQALDIADILKALARDASEGNWPQENWEGLYDLNYESMKSYNSRDKEGSRPRLREGVDHYILAGDYRSPENLGLAFIAAIEGTGKLSARPYELLQDYFAKFKNIKPGDGEKSLEEAWNAIYKTSYVLGKMPVIGLPFKAVSKAMEKCEFMGMIPDAVLLSGYFFNVIPIMLARAEAEYLGADRERYVQAYKNLTRDWTELRYLANDGWVTVQSAHRINEWKQDAHVTVLDTIESEWVDETASHTRLQRTEKCFQRISHLLVEHRKTASSNPFGGTRSLRRLDRTRRETGEDTGGDARARVSPVSVFLSLAEGEQEDVALHISQTNETGVLFTYADGDAEFTLLAPDGRSWTGSSEAEGVFFKESDGNNGGIETLLVRLSASEPSIWTARVSAVRVVADHLSGVIRVNDFNEDLDVDLSLEEAVVELGGDLVMRVGAFHASEPVQDASVFLLALHEGPEDGTNYVLEASDDGIWPDEVAGDGLYTAAISTERAGVYSIYADITSDGPVPFARRVGEVRAVVVEGGAELQGPHFDEGEGTSENGLFDRLRVDLTVNVAAAGDYMVVAALLDGTGEYVLASYAAEHGLEAGVQTLSLPFDGRALYAAREDGPYRLGVFRMTRIFPGGDYVPLIAQEDVHETAPYSYRQFRHGPIELLGMTEAAVDTTGSGRYDQLTVEIEVDVREDMAGWMEWRGDLADGTGRVLGTVEGSGMVTAGVNRLTVTFDGAEIGMAGRDGPYVVRNFTFLELLGYREEIAVLGQTSAYRAFEFEGFSWPFLVSYTELLADGRLRLEWYGQTGTVYRLEYARDLAAGPWHGVPGVSNIAGAGAHLAREIELVAPTNVAHFYRITTED